MSFGESGTEQKGAAVACQCLVGAAVIELRIAHIVVRVGKLRVDRERAAVACEPILDSPEPQQRAAQVVVGLGVTGIEVRAAAASRRVIELLEIKQCLSQIVMRFGEIRFQEQSAPKACQRRLEPPSLAKALPRLLCAPTSSGNIWTAVLNAGRASLPCLVWAKP